MGGDYRVSKCEDTGKLALYHNAGCSMWVLIAHEPDFPDILKVLEAAVPNVE